jgi:hypothetical protein
MSTHYKFYKTEQNRWYIDLPEWNGIQADLEMVAGADTMLDELSNNDNEIILNISDNYSDKDNWKDYIMLERWKKYSQLEGGGAEYKWGDKIIWLCDVTKFVFGEFPKYIIFKIVND